MLLSTAVVAATAAATPPRIQDSVAMPGTDVASMTWSEPEIDKVAMWQCHASVTDVARLTVSEHGHDKCQHHCNELKTGVLALG